MPVINLALIGVSDTMQPNQLLQISSMEEAERLHVDGPLKRSLQKVFEAQFTPASELQTSVDSLDVTKSAITPNIALYNCKPLRRAESYVNFSREQGNFQNVVKLQSNVWGEKGKGSYLSWNEGGLREEFTLYRSHQGAFKKVNSVPEKINFSALRVLNFYPIHFRLEITETQIIFQENDSNVQIGALVPFEFVVDYQNKNLKEVINLLEQGFELLAAQDYIAARYSSEYRMQVQLGDLASSQLNKDAYEYLDKGFFDVKEGLDAYPILPGNFLDESQPYSSVDLEVRLYYFANLINESAIYSQYLNAQRLFLQSPFQFEIHNGLNTDFHLVVDEEKLSFVESNTSGPNILSYNQFTIELASFFDQPIKSLMDALSDEIASVNAAIPVGVSGSLALSYNEENVLQTLGKLIETSQVFAHNDNAEVHAFLVDSRNSLADGFQWNQERIENSFALENYFFAPLGQNGGVMSLSRPLRKENVIEAFVALESEQVEFFFCALERSLFYQRKDLINQGAHDYLAGLGFFKDSLQREDLLEIHRAAKEHLDYLSHMKRGRNRIYIAAGADNRVSLAENIKFAQDLESERVLYVPYGEKFYFKEGGLYDDSPAHLAASLVGRLIYNNRAQDVSFQYISEQIEVDDVSSQRYYLKDPNVSIAQRSKLSSYGMIYALNHPENMNRVIVSKVVNTLQKNKTHENKFISIRLFDEVRRSLHARIEEYRLQKLASGNAFLEGDLLSVIKGQVKGLVSGGMLDIHKLDQILGSVTVQLDQDSFTWDLDVILPRAVEKVVGEIDIIEN